MRRLAAAAGRRNEVEGRYTGSLRGQGVCGDCFDPFTHQERLLTARMVVLALLRRLGFWAPLEAHHANMPRLAQANRKGHEKGQKKGPTERAWKGPKERAYRKGMKRAYRKGMKRA